MISVIGIDSSGPSPAGRSPLAQAEIVFGTARFKVFAPPNCDYRPITPIDNMIEFIKGERNRDIAVLASGDPLFYGIGATLIRSIPSKCLQFFPALTSIQELCAKAKIPWHDISLHSLHGKQDITETIIQKEIGPDGKIKLGLLTGPTTTPNHIATVCLQLGIEKGFMVVGENLGMDSERIRTISLFDAAEELDFEPLNCVILQAETSHAPDGLFGRKEDLYKHQKGLITKREVRASVLAALELPFEGIMWDIGAGSGSVSIEAASLKPGLKIYAIEKDSKRISDIKSNRDSFCALGVRPIKGNAPEILESLPAPDRIFIGGGGNKIGEIIDVCMSKLRGNGPIVATAICLETLDTLLKRLSQALFDVEVAQIAISRMEPLGKGHILRPENPVFLIKAKKDRL